MSKPLSGSSTTSVLSSRNGLPDKCMRLVPSPYSDPKQRAVIPDVLLLLCVGLLLSAMKPISRRKFLATTALSLAAVRLGAQGQPESEITLDVAGEATGAHMPIDFVGLSYEVQQLVDPGFFSASNMGLVE